jgi:hypothetical protein
MSYPTQIASLHFQYKTVFDALKSFLPDKTDDDLALMVLEFKSKKELSKVSAEPKVPKVSAEPKVPKVPKVEPTEPVESKEPVEPTESPVPKAPKVPTKPKTKSKV